MRPFCPRSGGGRQATEMLCGDVASHLMVSGGRLGAAGDGRNWDEAADEINKKTKQPMK